ncbi:hypothetical protein EVAR_12841_1 [Eumeta japonica]|uniref:Uncharacterized protein n=1 Tax=Eumeta variegata TaxID=151549 RepID=A0A4C1UB45_EUMVA|nr:hypothetical protein EVAR_12841_1 [Eumeta japonica]
MGVKAGVARAVAVSHPAHSTVSGYIRFLLETDIEWLPAGDILQYKSRICPAFAPSPTDGTYRRDPVEFIAVHTSEAWKRPSLMPSQPSHIYIQMRALTGGARGRRGAAEMFLLFLPSDRINDVPPSLTETCGTTHGNPCIFPASSSRKKKKSSTTLSDRSGRAPVSDDPCYP